MKKIICAVNVTFACSLNYLLNVAYLMCSHGRVGPGLILLQWQYEWGWAKNEPVETCSIYLCVSLIQ